LEEKVLEEAIERLGRRWKNNINTGCKIMGYAGSETSDRLLYSRAPVGNFLAS
jgi:hypothetical protein